MIRFSRGATMLWLLLLSYCPAFGGTAESAVATPTVPAEKPAGSDGAAKIDLRIFYAGHPGSEREGDFVAFLEKRFARVVTGDLATFVPDQARDSDVVVLDYDGDGFEAPRPKLRGSDYRRATVTVGVVGAFICGQLGLKGQYL
jgi:hypothetical protein